MVIINIIIIVVVEYIIITITNTQGFINDGFMHYIMEYMRIIKLQFSYFKAKSASLIAFFLHNN